jgi:peroxiredoxin
MSNRLLSLLALCFLFSLTPSAINAANPPKAGEKAPGFALKTLDGQTVNLADVTTKGRTVLVVLRGWPGYQCPLCTRQVQEFVAAADGFATSGARVVMVYPGPADGLKTHAQDFLKNKQWPKEFTYLVDPDYTMVNAYGLRWNAPKETAYPSTFVLDRKGVVRFAKISKSHGDRTKAADVLAEVKKVSSD